MNEERKEKRLQLKYTTTYINKPIKNTLSHLHNQTIKLNVSFYSGKATMFDA